MAPQLVVLFFAKKPEPLPVLVYKYFLFAFHPHFDEPQDMQVRQPS